MAKFYLNKGIKQSSSPAMFMCVAADSFLSLLHASVLENGELEENKSGWMRGPGPLNIFFKDKICRNTI